MQPSFKVAIMILQVEGWVSEQFRICWFHFSVYPNYNNSRTKPGCLRHRSSHLGCRFGRIGGVGLLAVFAVFVGPVVYLCQGFVTVRNVVIYRYTCRPGELLARGGCLPKRIRFLFEAV